MGIGILNKKKTKKIGSLKSEDDGLNRIKEIFIKEFREPLKTKNVSRKIMKIRENGWFTGLEERISF